MITSFYGFVKYNLKSLSDTICVYLSIALNLHYNFFIPFESIDKSILLGLESPCTSTIEAGFEENSAIFLKLNKH